MYQFNLGTNDLQRAEAFYNELLPLIGGAQAFKIEKAVIYTLGDSNVRLSINKPYDDKTATPGNGVMVTLFAESPSRVEEIYAKALELGGTCEGKPGDRLDGVVYAAYFRDPDGNKFGVIYLPSK